jgi:hypothetical protein
MRRCRETEGRGVSHVFPPIRCRIHGDVRPACSPTSSLPSPPVDMASAPRAARVAPAVSAARTQTAPATRALPLSSRSTVVTARPRVATVRTVVSRADAETSAATGESTAVGGASLVAAADRPPIPAFQAFSPLLDQSQRIFLFPLIRSARGLRLTLVGAACEPRGPPEGRAAQARA